MATPKIEIAPELVAAGRRLYEQTDTPQQEIAAMMGVSRDTLRARAREWGWTRRPHTARALELLHAVRGAAAAAAPDAMPEALPAAKQPPSGPVTPEQRAALAQRIQNVVEREMTALERLLDKAGESGHGGAENSARALAGIARTLREVALLNRPAEAMLPDEADDDPIPRDIDEFRRELARRINAFVDARQKGDGGMPDGAEPPLGS